MFPLDTGSPGKNGWPSRILRRSDGRWEGAAQEALCRAFAQNGLPLPAVAVEAISSQFRFQLLQLTNLLGFGPRRFVQGNTPGFRLVELPVKGLSVRRSTGAHYRKDTYLSPAALRFIEILKSMTREIARDP